MNVYMQPQERDTQESLGLEITKELDTRGLTCPLPILRTKKGLADMLSGQILKVMATDPGAVRDFEAFARQTGNALVHADTAGPEFIFYLKKR
jgi:tRNA 2-thiouridine synthesizing protein A